MDLTAACESDLPNISTSLRDSLVNSKRWFYFNTVEFYDNVYDKLKKGHEQGMNLIICIEHRKDNLKIEGNDYFSVIMPRSQSKNIKNANLKAFTPRLYYRPRPVQQDNPNYKQELENFGLFYATFFNQFKGIKNCEGSQIFQTVDLASDMKNKPYQRLIQLAEEFNKKNVMDTKHQENPTDGTTNDEYSEDDDLEDFEITHQQQKNNKQNNKQNQKPVKFMDKIQQKQNQQQQQQKQQLQKPAQTQSQQSQKKQNQQSLFDIVEDEENDNEGITIKESIDELKAMISSLADQIQHISQRLDEVTPDRKKVKVQKKPAKKQPAKVGRPKGAKNKGNNSKMQVEDQQQNDKNILEDDEDEESEGEELEESDSFEIQEVKKRKRK